MTTATAEATTGAPALALAMQPWHRERPILEAWLPRGEAAVIRQALRGEERDFFRDMLAALQYRIEQMPQTGDTDGQGDAAVANLHYFRGSCDAWITELDRGAEGDAPEDYQAQAFGLMDLGYGPELGYVSIRELIANGMELDLYWTPKPLAECRKRE
jgi:hypothetical protein